MKKLRIFIAALMVSVLLISAFKHVGAGGMFGKVTPVDGASLVSLVAGRDTLKAQIVRGSFTFSNLKEGVYTLSIKANAPYKDMIIEKVAVKDSARTDLGEIKLQQ